MNKIFNILKKQKSIPLDKYIDVALYDNKFGYYIKKNPFGKKGDYITAPLISNLFSEMIAIWCVAFWEYLEKPKKILLVELGPGNGSLSKDLLNTFKNFKNFSDSLEINLIEKSSTLKKIQKINIKNKKAKWIKNINEINYGPVIFLGNEFFDSMPIKQIYKKNKIFYEKHVTLSKNNKNIRFLDKRANKNLVKNIKNFNLISGQNIVEYPEEAILYLKKISKKIEKYDGGLLSFDYGYTKQKSHYTLQAVSKHKYTNVLKDPGNADITSHINYKLFSQILLKENLQTEKIITQNEFLQKMGIIERANILANKMNFSAKANMFYRLKKLLHQNEMGKLFKVLFAKKKKNKFSLGFE